MTINIRHRATAVIYKDEKVLIFRRVKPNAEYFVFPGGGLNHGETIEQALVREVREELSLHIDEFKYLFTIDDLKIDNGAINYSKDIQNHHYYLITDFVGVPELSGPEKESAHEGNQYHIEWFTWDALEMKEKIYPRDIVARLRDVISAIHNDDEFLQKTETCVKV